MNNTLVWGWGIGLKQNIILSKLGLASEVDYSQAYHAFRTFDIAD